MLKRGYIYKRKTKCINVRLNQNSARAMKCIPRVINYDKEYDIYYVYYKGLKYQIYNADNKACIYLNDKRTGNVL